MFCDPPWPRPQVNVRLTAGTVTAAVDPDCVIVALHVRVTWGEQLGSVLTVRLHPPPAGRVVVLGDADPGAPPQPEPTVMINPRPTAEPSIDHGRFVMRFLLEGKCRKTS